MAQVLTRLKGEMSEDPASPIARLVAWQTEHLETSIKGRMQEAHRQPVVGGKPATTG
jgi:hypothetical protein